MEISFGKHYRLGALLARGRFMQTYAARDELDASTWFAHQFIDEFVLDAAQVSELVTTLIATLGAPYQAEQGWILEPMPTVPPLTRVAASADNVKWLPLLAAELESTDSPHGHIHAALMSVSNGQCLLPGRGLVKTAHQIKGIAVSADDRYDLARALLTWLAPTLAVDASASAIADTVGPTLAATFATYLHVDPKQRPSTLGPLVAAMGKRLGVQLRVQTAHTVSAQKTPSTEELDLAAIEIAVMADEASKPQPTGDVTRAERAISLETGDYEAIVDSVPETLLRERDATRPLPMVVVPRMSDETTVVPRVQITPRFAGRDIATVVCACLVAIMLIGVAIWWRRHTP